VPGSSLAQRDGIVEALYGRWVLGKQAVRRQPRWSITRNVLHWVNDHIADYPAV